jgi:predicted amidohydrolase YtcJ
MKSNLIVRCLSICAVALTSGSQVVAQSKPAADLIVTHAKVWTVDRSQPKAEAIAVLGERIVAVGSSAEVDAWRGPNTRIIDAGGKLVVPGFNDAHVHFVDGGRQLDAVQLNDATTPEEFKRRIAERVKITPKLGRNQVAAFTDADPATHRRCNRRHPGLLEPLRRARRVR